ncbi:cell division FtsZ-interacting protein ZapD [Pantoea ananatis]|nr:cell division FtsZ-interacting protein ZapD [Pantoea ananatis]
MSTVVLFEHPLNEKMRTWLRVEFLIDQLHDIMPLENTATALTFFRLVGELLDIFERGDMRTELLKELERQQTKLRAWADVPGSRYVRGRCIA